LPALLRFAAHAHNRRSVKLFHSFNSVKDRRRPAR
jgi:hypothetical protein